MKEDKIYAVTVNFTEWVKASDKHEAIEKFVWSGALDDVSSAIEAQEELPAFASTLEEEDMIT